MTNAIASCVPVRRKQSLSDDNLLMRVLDKIKNMYINVRKDNILSKVKDIMDGVPIALINKISGSTTYYPLSIINICTI